MVILQGVMSDVPASKGHKGGFAVQHMVKDLSLALEAAATEGSPTPMTEKALEIYEEVGRLGLTIEKIIGCRCGIGQYPEQRASE